MTSRSPVLGQMSFTLLSASLMTPFLNKRPSGCELIVRFVEMTMDLCGWIVFFVEKRIVSFGEAQRTMAWTSFSSFSSTLSVMFHARVEFV